MGSIVEVCSYIIRFLTFLLILPGNTWPYLPLLKSRAHVGWLYVVLERTRLVLSRSFSILGFTWAFDTSLDSIWFYYIKMYVCDTGMDMLSGKKVSAVSGARKVASSAPVRTSRIIAAAAAAPVGTCPCDILVKLDTFFNGRLGSIV